MVCYAALVTVTPSPSRMSQTTFSGQVDRLRILDLSVCVLAVRERTTGQSALSSSRLFPFLSLSLNVGNEGLVGTLSRAWLEAWKDVEEQPRNGQGTGSQFGFKESSARL